MLAPEKMKTKDTIPERTIEEIRQELEEAKRRNDLSSDDLNWVGADTIYCLNRELEQAIKKAIE